MKKVSGYSFIEIILSMGIFLTLASMATVIGFNSLNRTQFNTSLELLISDLASQQQKAINRQIGNSDNQAHGIYFKNNSYTLFSGLEYQDEDVQNEEIILENGITIENINLPNDQIIFSQNSGFVDQYQATQSSIIIFSNMRSVKLNFNRYGVVEIEEMINP